jgi:hypothetical protein
LEAALKPLLDVDQTLWFLALDVALINNDGYWVRASDYSIYLDGKGIFHMIPHDMNEAFHGAMMFGGRGPGGPGGPRGPDGRPSEPRRGSDEPNRSPRDQGGPGAGPGVGPNPTPGGFFGLFGGGPPGGSGVELDPLVALDDPRKPLRSKLLAVPELKARYLKFVRQIAEEDLDWNSMQPVIRQYQQLIESEIKADTRKLSSFAEFQAMLSDQPDGETRPEVRRRTSLRSFMEQRRAYLMKYQEPK